MTPPAAKLPRVSTGATFAIAAVAAAGFAVTILAFYPGYLTRDAFYIYENVREGLYGDWQGPLMAMIWRMVDPLAPGTASIFLLTAGVYWLAFGLLGIALARRSFWLGMAALALALAPPAWMFLAMVWRDMLFGVSWLLAAVIAYAGAHGENRQRWITQALAIGLIALGILLRPNAIVAAPLLILQALWPQRFDWKRAALLFLPGLAAGYALIHVTYYEIIGVKREYPERSVVVFDLGGMTHFARQNQFPVTWTQQETAFLTAKCYDPERWDVYWTIEPCPFVMKRLEAEGLFKGAPQLMAAWINAILAHPLAYLQHRMAFFWRFLAGDNLTLAQPRLEDQHNVPLMNDPWFKTVLRWHSTLKSTVLFRTGFWLALAILIFASGWRWRGTPSGAFVLGVTGSAIFYVLSYAVFGVAAEFRYGYWCVLACLAAAPALAAAQRELNLTASTTDRVGKGAPG